ERVQTIARTYAEQPEGTLVISPDNKSRMELNRAIHGEATCFRLSSGNIGRFLSIPFSVPDPLQHRSARSRRGNRIPRREGSWKRWCGYHLLLPVWNA
ncbi:MAG: hypothetical protein ABSG03_31430, partial [Bryobacteraceae bacterium]